MLLKALKSLINQPKNGLKKKKPSITKNEKKPNGKKIEKKLTRSMLMWNVNLELE